MSLLDHYVIRRTARLLTASPHPVAREETKIVQKRGGDRNGNIYIFSISGMEGKSSVCSGLYPIGGSTSPSITSPIMDVLPKIVISSRYKFDFYQLV